MTVHDQDGVAADDVAHLLAQPQRVNGRGVRVQQRSRPLAVGALLGREPGHPRGLARGVEPARGLAGQLLQDQFGVADDTDRGRPVVADGAAVQVDVDEPRGRRKTRRAQERQHGVGSRPDHEHHVGLAEGHRPGRGKGAHVVFGNHAAALRGGEERDAGRLDEGAQFRAGARPQNPAAGHDERFFGAGQEFDRLRDQRRVPRGPALDAVVFGPIHLVCVHLVAEHVPGQVQIDWAFLAVHGLAEGEADVFGHALRHVDAVGRLDDGLHHGELVHLLKRVQGGGAHGCRAADGDDRAGVRPGVGQTGDGVGGAGARRRDADAGFTRDAGIGVRHHGRGLFVPHVDTAHAEVETRGRGAAGRPAHHEEESFDVLPLEALCDKFFAANRTHVSPP